MVKPKCQHCGKVLTIRNPDALLRRFGTITLTCPFCGHHNRFEDDRGQRVEKEDDGPAGV